MTKAFPIHPTDEAVIENPWQKLRDFTDARIGLGRAGISVPTEHLLRFQLAHAKAQDAVHTPLNIDGLIESLAKQLWCPKGKPVHLHSQAKDRPEYLQQPDFGRLLNDASTKSLLEIKAKNKSDYDLAIVIVDGLSALAIEENTIPFLSSLIPQLMQQNDPWNIAPLCIVEQGRVAIGDAVGSLLKAKCVLLLVGERPGLSSPDSMGLYLTWNPTKGLTDAYRNCISNIRLAGLNFKDASFRAKYLLNEARNRKISGVKLKDRSGESILEHDMDSQNFLIANN